VTERLLRLVLLAIMAGLFVSLQRQGRGARVQEPAALLRYSSGTVVVGMAGSMPHPGIYRFHDGSTVETAINMTMPGAPLSQGARRLFGKQLQNGQILRMQVTGSEHVEITIENMKALERVLVGMPLDPDAMDYEDWLALPGLGPKLARTIVENRQQYGAFGSLSGLQRVPGVGAGKIDIIKNYF
jgi:competence protein ComEA